MPKHYEDLLKPICEHADMKDTYEFKINTKHTKDCSELESCLHIFVMYIEQHFDYLLQNWITKISLKIKTSKKNKINLKKLLFLKIT